MNGAPTAPKTAEALPQIITILKTRGYEFVKVNELLGLPAEPKIIASNPDFRAVLGAATARLEKLLLK